MKQFERELDKMPVEVREKNMELTTSWEQKGREIGRIEGRVEGLWQGQKDLVIRQIKKRFGSVSSTLLEQLDRLSQEQISDLGLLLLDFNNASDLEYWVISNINKQ